MSTGFDQLHSIVQHHVVNSLGWRELRPLQDQAVAPILAGEHVLALAPTAGERTGKSPNRTLRYRLEPL